MPSSGPTAVSVADLVDDAKRAAHSKRTRIDFHRLPLRAQLIYLSAYEVFLRDREARALLN